MSATLMAIKAFGFTYNDEFMYCARSY